jgi:Fe-S cluster biogenesis protein NfuA
MTSASVVLEQGFETLAERVDQSVSAVLALDLEARDKAMMLKQAVEDFHQFALARLIQLLKGDEHGRELLYGLLDEPSVYSLFAMHGLIRIDPKTRVMQALESARPYLQSHGGDIELVDVRENDVYLRLHGICSDCATSSSTLRNVVEKSIRAQMPDIGEIVVLPKEGPAMDGIIPLNEIAIAG